MTVLVLSVSLVAYLSLGYKKGESVHGVKDELFNATGGLNEYFREDPSRRTALLIVCSTMLDILVLLSLYRFARYSTTFRLPLALAPFYALREIL